MAKKLNIFCIGDSHILKEALRKIEDSRIHNIPNTAAVPEFISSKNILPDILILDQVKPGVNINKLDNNIYGIPTIIVTHDSAILLKHKGLDDFGDYINSISVEDVSRGLKKIIAEYSNSERRPVIEKKVAELYLPEPIIKKDETRIKSPYYTKTGSIIKNESLNVFLTAKICRVEDIKDMLVDVQDKNLIGNGYQLYSFTMDKESLVQNLVFSKSNNKSCKKVIIEYASLDDVDRFNDEVVKYVNREGFVGISDYTNKSIRYAANSPKTIEELQKKVIKDINAVPVQDANDIKAGKKIVLPRYATTTSRHYTYANVAINYSGNPVRYPFDNLAKMEAIVKELYKQLAEKGFIRNLPEDNDEREKKINVMADKKIDEIKLKFLSLMPIKKKIMFLFNP